MQAFVMAPAGSYMGLEYPLHALLHPQHVTDDPSAHLRVAELPTGGHSSDTGRELDFAYRPHLFRSVGAVHGPRVEKHRSDDVVARACVDKEFIEKIAEALVLT